jgi:phosphate transport system protein
MTSPEQQKGRRHFRDELDELQGMLLEMGGIVEELVRRTVSAFLERDAAMVDWAKREDDRIDELEVDIDEAGLELLALFQPMASDLRHITSALKVSSDLERVADHGVNIAKAAGRIAGMPGMPAVPELAEMAEIARGMLADCLACYISRDANAARAVLARDVKVDRLRRSLFRILLTHMLEDPRRISPSLEVLLVAQNLERIADLSTNIAEDVVFIVEGRTIKHHHEGRPPAEDDEAV